MRSPMVVLLALLLAACAAAPGGSVAPDVSVPALPTSTPIIGSPSSPAPSASRPSDPAALNTDPLHSIMLVDVRTGASFTIGQLAAERPVLLEAMAIWCTNCRAQQGAVADAHSLADFGSISLDVDPNERAADLAHYAEREGFDWAFAIAGGDLARMLLDRFGSAVLNPPSTPKVLFRTDGSVELVGLGEILDAGQIAALVRD